MNTQTAILLAGSKAKLAIILGVSRPAVTQYRERLPKKRIAVLMEKCPQWFEEKPPEVEIKEAVLTPV